jgi:hypothetical protein
VSLGSKVKAPIHLFKKVIASVSGNMAFWRSKINYHIWSKSQLKTGDTNKTIWAGLHFCMAQWLQEKIPATQIISPLP